MSRARSCLHWMVVGLIAQPLIALGADAPVIIQQHRAFSQSQIAVPVGTKVEFKNSDDFGHQIYVEAPDFTFESNEQDTGESVPLLFSVKGHFTVLCHIHPKMKLNVDVQ